MELLELVGFTFVILIGCIMGLMGSGGSLIVPVLFYLFGIEINLATGYALFTVGMTAVIGAQRKWKRDEVDLKTAIVFAIPVFLSTIWVRASLINQIPDVLFTIGSYQFEDDTAILILYSIMLLLSFTSMKGLWGKNLQSNDAWKNRNPGLYLLSIILAGTFIGVLSALVGAGGGILVVPVLVVLVGQPMKLAVGTSLTIMGAKSLIGFVGDVVNQGEMIDWLFLGKISTLMIIGILVGTYLSAFIPGSQLKKGFSWLILGMAVMIIMNELILSQS